MMLNIFQKDYVVLKIIIVYMRIYREKNMINVYIGLETISQCNN